MRVFVLVCLGSLSLFRGQCAQAKNNDNDYRNNYDYDRRRRYDSPYYRGGDYYYRGRGRPSYYDDRGRYGRYLQALPSLTEYFKAYGLNLDSQGATSLSAEAGTSNPLVISPQKTDAPFSTSINEILNDLGKYLRDNVLMPASRSSVLGTPPTQPQQEPLTSSFSRSVRRMLSPEMQYDRRREHSSYNGGYRDYPSTTKYPPQDRRPVRPNRERGLGGESPERIIVKSLAKQFVGSDGKLTPFGTMALQIVGLDKAVEKSNILVSAVTGESVVVDMSTGKLTSDIQKELRKRGVKAETPEGLIEAVLDGDLGDIQLSDSVETALLDILQQELVKLTEKNQEKALQDTMDGLRRGVPTEGMGYPSAGQYVSEGTRVQLDPSRGGSQASAGLYRSSDTTGRTGSSYQEQPGVGVPLITSQQTGPIGVDRDENHKNPIFQSLVKQFISENGYLNDAGRTIMTASGLSALATGSTGLMSALLGTTPVVDRTTGRLTDSVREGLHRMHVDGTYPEDLVANILNGGILSDFDFPDVDSLMGGSSGGRTFAEVDPRIEESQVSPFAELAARAFEARQALKATAGQYPTPHDNPALKTFVKYYIGEDGKLTAEASELIQSTSGLTPTALEKYSELFANALRRTQPIVDPSTGQFLDTVRSEALKLIVAQLSRVKYPEDIAAFGLTRNFNPAQRRGLQASLLPNNFLNPLGIDLNFPTWPTSGGLGNLGNLGNLGQGAAGGPVGGLGLTPNAALGPAGLFNPVNSGLNLLNAALEPALLNTRLRSAAMGLYRRLEARKDASLRKRKLAADGTNMGGSSQGAIDDLLHRLGTGGPTTATVNSDVLEPSVIRPGDLGMNVVSEQQQQQQYAPGLVGELSQMRNRLKQIEQDLFPQAPGPVIPNIPPPAWASLMMPGNAQGVIDPRAQAGGNMGMMMGGGSPMGMNPSMGSQQPMSGGMASPSGSAPQGGLAQLLNNAPNLLRSTIEQQQQSIQNFIESVQRGVVPAPPYTVRSLLQRRLQAVDNRQPSFNDLYTTPFRRLIRENTETASRFEDVLDYMLGDRIFGQSSNSDDSVFDMIADPVPPASVRVDGIRKFSAQDGGRFYGVTCDIPVELNSMSSPLVSPLLICWELSEKAEGWPDFVIETAILELFTSSTVAQIDLVNLANENPFTMFAPEWNNSQARSRAQNQKCVWVPACKIMETLFGMKTGNSVSARLRFEGRSFSQGINIPDLKVVVRGEAAQGQWIKEKVTISEKKMRRALREMPGGSNGIFGSFMNSVMHAFANDGSTGGDSGSSNIAKSNLFVHGSPFMLFELPNPSAKDVGSFQMKDDKVSAFATGYAMSVEIESPQKPMFTVSKADYDWIPPYVRPVYDLILSDLKMKGEELNETFGEEPAAGGDRKTSPPEDDDEEGDYGLGYMLFRAAKGDMYGDAYFKPPQFNPDVDLPITSPEFGFSSRIVVEIVSKFGNQTADDKRQFVRRCLPSGGELADMGFDMASSIVAEMLHESNESSDTAVRLKSILEITPTQASFSKASGFSVFEIRESLINEYSHIDWNVSVSLAPLSQELVAQTTHNLVEALAMATSSDASSIDDLLMLQCDPVTRECF